METHSSYNPKTRTITSTGWTNAHTPTHPCIHWIMTCPQLDWLIDWLIDRSIDWLIHWWIDWLIDWLIGWLVDFLRWWVVEAVKKITRMEWPLSRVHYSSVFQLWSVTDVARQHETRQVVSSSFFPLRKVDLINVADGIIHPPTKEPKTPQWPVDRSHCFTIIQGWFDTP